MPNHAEIGADDAGRHQAVDNLNRLRRQHFLGAQAVGQIAVAAVDIAKRCRLQHKQFDSFIG